MPVEIDINYEGGLHCAAVHGPSKMTLETDAPTDNGGKGETFSPTDLAATALGTCVMTIMGLIAKRDNIDLKGTKIKVIKEMADKPLRRIGSLKMTIQFPKELLLSDTQRKKLENTVNSCPVRQSLHPDVKIETEFSR